MAQLPSVMLVVDNEQPCQDVKDRFIVVQTRHHPFVNETILRNELRNGVGVSVSMPTVRSRLRQSGLRSRRACIRIPLTLLHKQARLNWAQDHVN